MKTPWQRADATGNEHAHQSALFQWAAMAVFAGVVAADDPKSYTVKGHAASLVESGASTPVPQLAWLFAIHNQGHGDAIRGNRARSEGVRRGVPDLCLPVPRKAADLGSAEWGDKVKPFGDYPGLLGGVVCGLYIELKRPDSVGKKAGKASNEQDKWSVYLNFAGYAVEVCVGWLEARACILRYLGLA